MVDHPLDGGSASRAAAALGPAVFERGSRRVCAARPAHSAVAPTAHAVDWNVRPLVALRSKRSALDRSLTRARACTSGTSAQRVPAGAAALLPLPAERVHVPAAIDRRHSPAAAVGRLGPPRRRGRRLEHASGLACARGGRYQRGRGASFRDGRARRGRCSCCRELAERPAPSRHCASAERRGAARPSAPGCQADRATCRCGSFGADAPGAFESAPHALARVVSSSAVPQGSAGWRAAVSG